MPKKRKTIVILSAHSDDFVLGAGGTIAHYAAVGMKVKAIVFSYGEKSHPWLKPAVVQKFRSQEAFRAGKLLGCTVKFLQCHDQRIKEEFTVESKEKLLEELSQLRPEKIFTHSSEDPHPDHRAVYQITLEIYAQLPVKPELYIYSIWNPVSFRRRFPTLYVDISSTFSKKLEALRAFPSQRFNAIYPLMILVFKRAFFGGLKIRKKFAESFYRIR